jgi:hypothetical protein
MQRAKAKFHAPGRWVAKGELFADDDPFLEGRAVLFEHVDVPESQPKATDSEPEEHKPEPEPKKSVAPRPGRKTTAKKPTG